MKILAFTDIHGDKKLLKTLIAKSKKADVLVCCGDIAMFGANLVSSLKTLAKANKPLLIIPGNHEDNRELQHATSKLSFTTNLHKHYKIIDNVCFVGYGEGGFARTEIGLEKYFKTFMKQGIHLNYPTIFITHAPPYKTKLDYIPSLKQHCGCKSTLHIITTLKPLLCLSGHFHETFHKHDKIG